MDLMYMSVKYQVLNCTWPGELLHVTQNHLDNIKLYCLPSGTINAELTDTLQRIHDLVLPVSQCRKTNF